MKNWLQNLNRRFETMMIGRYGTDELSRTLLWAGIILMLVCCFVKVPFLYPLSWVLVIYAYFRSFSKNIIKRSRERDKFMRSTAKIRSKFSMLKRRWKDRKTHNYYRCPKCKTMIRVPKGKGKIAITCPKCRNEIIKTT